MVPGPLVLWDGLRTPSSSEEGFILTQGRSLPVSRRDELSRVPLSPANSRTLPTFCSRRMRSANIEVPNPAVDSGSWAGLACYPRGTFDPLRSRPFTRNTRVSTIDLRPCSTRQSHSQADIRRSPLPPIAVRSAVYLPCASGTFWEALAPRKLSTMQYPASYLKIVLDRGPIPSGIRGVSHGRGTSEGGEPTWKPLLPRLRRSS